MSIWDYMSGESQTPEVPVQEKVSQSPDINSLVASAASKYGVDPNDIHGIIKHESDYNPNAISPSDSNGRTAQGLMQLREPAAQEMGVSNRMDPEQNINGGVGYYAKQLARFGGNREKALAAYRLGAGNVPSNGPIPQEAQDYISKVTNHANSLSSPKTSSIWDSVGEQKNATVDGGSIWDSIESGSGIPAPSLQVTTSTQGNPILNNIKDSLKWSYDKLVSPNLNETLSNPVSPAGKLPIGMGSTENQPEWAKHVLDVGYGLPEAAYTIAGGGLGFVGGVLGGGAKFVTSTAKQLFSKDPVDITKALQDAKSVSDKVNEFFSYQPITNTGQSFVKPINVAFGTAIGTLKNSVAEIATANNPVITPEELIKKQDSAEFLFNASLLLVPHVMGKMKSGEIITPKDISDVKSAVEGIKERANEDGQNIPKETPDIITKAFEAATEKGKVDAIVPAETVGQEVKNSVNQSIVNGLNLDASAREGVKKSAYEKAAEIVAEHPDDIASVDLTKIKGIGEKIGARINELVKEREGQKTEPISPEDKPSQNNISDENLAAKIGWKPVTEELLPPGKVPEGKSIWDSIGEEKSSNSVISKDTLESIAPGLEYQGSSKLGGTDLHNFMTSDGRNFNSLTLDPTDIKQRLNKINEGFEKKSEASIVSEFDTKELARDQGYQFRDKRQFDSQEAAQKVADRKGDGHDVVKIGEKYRVAKYNEEPIPQYDSLDKLQGDKEVGSEISKAQAIAENGVGDGFGVAQVGDKFYRTVDKYEMPSRQPDISGDAIVSSGHSDMDLPKLNPFEPDSGITPEDVALMKDMFNGKVEETLKKSSEELHSMKDAPPSVKSQPDYHAAAVRFIKEYRDSYVAKINVASDVSDSHPSEVTKVTPSKLSALDDNFKTFKTEEEAKAYAEASGKSGEIIKDPMSGEFFLEPEIDMLDDHGWEKDLDIDREVSLDSLSDESPEFGLSDHGTRDLVDEFYSHDINPVNDGVGPGLFKNPKDMIQSIADNSKNPLFRIIAEKIAPALEDTKLEIYGNDSSIESIPEGLHTSNGLYTPSKDTIYLKDNLMGKTSGERTQLHEAIHAATLHGIKEGMGDLIEGKDSVKAKAYQDLVELSKTVSEHFSKNILDYGEQSEIGSVVKITSTSIPELITYGLTNEKFINFLKEIPVGEANAFSKFVATIRKMLNIPIRASNAFTKLLDITESLTDAKVRDKKSSNPLMNQRGSADLTPFMTQERLDAITHKAKKMGKSVEEFLDSVGMSKEDIDAFKVAMGNTNQNKDRLRKEYPMLSEILMPEGRVISQRVKMDINGKVKSVFPAITETWSRMVTGARKGGSFGKEVITKSPITGFDIRGVDSNIGQDFLSHYETPINAHRFFGTEKFYRMYRDFDAARKDRQIEYEKKLKGFRDTLSEGELIDLALYRYRNDASMPDTLKALGKDEIPKMNDRQRAYSDYMDKTNASMFDEINYARTHTGQDSIPKTEDYTHIIRSVAALRSMGLGDGLVSSDLNRLQLLSKDYKGMFNANAIRRSGTGLPIELDVTKAMIDSLNYNLKEIHMAPLAALLKELVNEKFDHPIEGVGKMSLMEWNPALAKFLLRWSDEIMGKDIVADALRVSRPKTFKYINTINKNLVAAAIAGNLSTIVKHISTLSGTYTITGLTNTIYGITKTAWDRPRLGETSKAWTEGRALRAREFAAYESDFAEMVQQGLVTGAKKWTTENTLKGIKYMTGFMSEIAWNAAERYGRKSLKMEEGSTELNHWADDLVDRTQGSGSKGAVSPSQTNIFSKMFNLLGTFGIADFNLILRDVLGYKNPDVTKGQMMVRVIRHTVAMAVLGQALKMAGLPGLLPDPVGAFIQAKEEGKDDTHTLMHTAATLLEKVPVLGSMLQYNSSIMGPFGGWADLIPQAIHAMGSSVDWDEISESQKEKNMLIMAKAVGYTFGIPCTNQIIKSVRAEWNGGNPYQVIMGVYVKKKGSGEVKF
jgi:hypothetical protein